MDLGLDTRKPLTRARITGILHWCTRDEALALSVARAEVLRLAKRITTLDAELKDNDTRTTELLETSPAAPLLDETGLGTVPAAVVYTAWSHPGRVRSGRHRLNRRGSRRLNSALHMATAVRMVHDPATRFYAERRKAEGKDSTRDHSQETPRPAPLPGAQRAARTRYQGLEARSTDIEDSDHQCQGEKVMLGPAGRHTRIRCQERVASFAGRGVPGHRLSWSGQRTARHLRRRRDCCS